MRAIGSSYLVRQSPSAERYGGVTVEIRPRKATQGTIVALPTDWRTEKPIEDDVAFLTDAAIEGIKKFAKDNDLNLDEWDIAVSRFAYHPIDSSARTTQIAAYNAAASAFASWYSIRLGPKGTGPENPSV